MCRRHIATAVRNRQKGARPSSRHGGSLAESEKDVAQADAGVKKVYKA